VDIELTEPVSLTFALKYLVNFCKASALSNQVKICLAQEVPLLVEYPLSGNSYLRFYLAPKVRPLSLVMDPSLGQPLLTSGTDQRRRVNIISRHNPELCMVGVEVERCGHSHTYGRTPRDGEVKMDTRHCWHFTCSYLSRRWPHRKWLSLAITIMTQDTFSQFARAPPAMTWSALNA
jgi:hypothetical protein